MNLKALETEQRNPRTYSIDTMSTAEILETINQEDAQIAASVKACIPSLTILVDEIFSRLEAGGRLLYVGAGTSGRLGVLDASECPPTYGVSPDMVQGIIAGGESALRNSIEGSEDKTEEGKNDLIRRGLTDKDAVVGLAASGRTPYVIGALDYAGSIGAYTGAISCVSNAELSQHAQISIEAVTGPEVVTGSTRMKAGTAQKLILNMISTSVMIKMGKVYQNLMIDVQPSNYKLECRARSIIEECLDCDAKTASNLLEAAQNDVKLAVFLGITGLDPEQGKTCLSMSGGKIQQALSRLEKKSN